jgi:CheY-like chemotaxis protein
MTTHDIRHLASETPRVMVVDGSRLVRKLIGDVLRRELPDVEVVDCAGLADARAALEAAPIDLATTSLVLPDGDGLQLAHVVREAAGQRYVPVIVVSGDVQSHLETRRSSAATCSRRRSPARTCSTSRTVARWPWRRCACSRRSSCG